MINKDLARKNGTLSQSTSRQYRDAKKLTLVDIYYKSKAKRTYVFK